uniref:Uncharacterized protein n=1 Tax=Anguilla anguilla TaxID=7936 RepID=A0A0E9U336_ANGAN
MTHSLHTDILFILNTFILQQCVD